MLCTADTGYIATLDPEDTAVLYSRTVNKHPAAVKVITSFPVLTPLLGNVSDGLEDTKLRTCGLSELSPYVPLRVSTFRSSCPPQLRTACFHVYHTHVWKTG